VAESTLQDWQEAERRYQAGDLEGAAASCMAVLGRLPGNVPAHWMLSHIHQARRRFRLAHRHARLAASGVGSLGDRERLLVCRMLVSVGEYRAAMTVLRSLSPDAAHGAAVVTEAAELAGMLDDSSLALDWLRAAKRGALQSPTLSLLAGNHLKFTGDFAGAAGAYEDAIALDPRWPHAHLGLATLGDQRTAARNIDRIRAVLGDGTLGRADSAVMHYALFREADTLGDVPLAWQALEEGMRQRRQEIRHDRASEARMFERLLATYTPGFARPSGGPATEGPQPVFVVGLPRTGTTLLERILGNHSAVEACGERSEFRMLYKWATDYYCNGLLDEEAASRMQGVDAPALGRAYLEATSWRAAGKRWYVDKLPGNFLFSGLILRAIPGARIVYIRRNPMAACFGNLRELFAPYFYEYSYSMEDMAAHHRCHVSLMEHVRALAPDRVLQVDYEDLVTEPEGQVDRLLAFLGLPREPGLSDTTRPAKQVSTASSRQAREPIHTARIDYWKRYEQHLAPLRDALALE
jgi:hypothetical protein